MLPTVRTSACRVLRGAAGRAAAPRHSMLAARAAGGSPSMADLLALSPLVLSPRMTQRATRGILQDIDLMVCDMAGTTVQEGGLVYKVLQQCIVDGGLQASDEEMHPWHGAKKEAVIEHFARKAGVPEADLEAKILECADKFLAGIDQAYFNDASTIGHIEAGLFGYFDKLKRADIKIGLDTGYPKHIQEGLVQRLGFDKVVDGYVSSYEVAEGRPYPYMIYRLMEELRIEDVRRVAKVGDSVRDIEEGLNAGCGLVVGVLSGADSAEDLMAAGAHVIARCVTDLPVPMRKSKSQAFRLPDLS